MQKQDVNRHIQRVHEKVKRVGGKLRYMCSQCPSGYSNVRMYDQHVKGVHAPAKQEDEEHVKIEVDIGNDLLDELEGREGPSSSSGDKDREQNMSATELVVDNKDRPGKNLTEDLLNTERSVGSGTSTSEIGQADENREKEELAEKEPANKERVVEPSEEETGKETRAKMDLLNGLKKKYEYLCKKVGSEKAESIFQKVYVQCRNAANKPN